MITRLQHLRSQFDPLGIDAFLVTFQPHLRYLSGFTGSNGVGVVSKHGVLLVTDMRYADQVRSEAPSWKPVLAPDSLFEALRARELLRNGWRVGFDGNTLTYAAFTALKKLFPKVKFRPKVDTVEKIAAVKDAAEIARIRRAVGITDTVFSEILGLLRTGITELDVAAEISYRQRRHGAEADAFETIVASGPRSALPHGRATARKLRRGDLVTLDFGAVVDGYHSDMTRTVALGKPRPEARRIHGIVREAQQRSLEAVHAGMKARDLDAVARNIIDGYGYGSFYRHSLGHGIGLQIHEPPRISVLSSATLTRGNVVTVEPGIYIAGFGGVRVEDDIIVTDGGCEVLNRSTKELLIL